ncbi:hypothetical protein DXG01_009843 [Tephrocybe rancida]|nr:hypothetical protein DXG01_009843 [Tephrocybe rancida]
MADVTLPTPDQTPAPEGTPNIKPVLPRTTPEWIYKRLASYGERPPHFEASLYGPLNAILVTNYPPEDNFLVKPQTLIRLDEPNGTRNANSIDSYNANVADNFGKSPDFLVARVTPGSDVDDKVVIVVEVKAYDNKKQKKQRTAKEQLLTYLTQLQRKRNRTTGEPLYLGQNLYGLLVVADNVEIITLPAVGDLATLSPPVKFEDPTVTNLLQSLYDVYHTE